MSKVFQEAYKNAVDAGYGHLDAMRHGLYINYISENIDEHIIESNDLIGKLGFNKT